MKIAGFLIATSCRKRSLLPPAADSELLHFASKATRLRNEAGNMLDEILKERRNQTVSATE